MPRFRSCRLPSRLTSRSSRPRIVASTACYTLRLHAVAAPLWVGLTPALGPAMKFFAIFLAALFLAGCATSKNSVIYEPSSGVGSPGYRENLIATSTYHIVYMAFGQSTYKAAQCMAYRRANDLCNGVFVELPMDIHSVEIRSCHHYNSSCGPAVAQIWVRCGT